MDILRVDKHTSVGQSQVATIGFFDGVHLGHRYLLSQVCKAAKESGRQSMAVTFDRHPREVLQQDYQPQLLSTLDEKLRLLGETGIDHCAVLHFTRDMAGLPARTFMEEVLQKRLHVEQLIIGYDNRFGHDRTETFSDYVRYGRELGMEVCQAEAKMVGDIKVSSSKIRHFIGEGAMEDASRCMGHPYMLSGEVVEGYQEGRRLGFPTANISVDEGKLLPAMGVYAVEVYIEEKNILCRGMMNVGMRPTFGGDHETIEVNLLNFHDNLYGLHLQVLVVHRIRGEHRFATPEDLRRQIETDRETTNKYFNKIYNDDK